MDTFDVANFGQSFYMTDFFHPHLTSCWSVQNLTVTFAIVCMGSKPVLNTCAVVVSLMVVEQKTRTTGPRLLGPTVIFLQCRTWQEHAKTSTCVSFGGFPPS